MNSKRLEFTRAHAIRFTFRGGSAVLGAILSVHNVWLLLLIPIQWVILTVLIRNTEEKWLYELHGEAYKDYCARVNRWIPLKKI